MPDWWEKSVEYCYLASKIVEGGKIIIPFAGPMERDLGDAVEVEGNLFEIVEFKSDESGFRSENSKFGDGKTYFQKYYPKLLNYRDAKNLSFEILPHKFVYGVADGKRLDYDEACYWDTAELATGPAEESEFLDYLKCFVAIRKPSEQGAASGSVVFGLDTELKIVSCQPLEHLLEALRMGRRFVFPSAKSKIAYGS